MVIAVPQFKAHYRAVAIPGDGALLLWEGGAYALRGEAFARVVPLIDGSRSADDIVLALSGTLDPALAWSALMTLEADGHLVDSDVRTDRDEAAFWWTLGVDPLAAAAALQAARVRVFACSVPAAERFRQALSRYGIAASASAPMAPADPPPSGGGSGNSAASSLDAVLTDDYLSDDLVRADQAARDAGRPWLPARLRGTRIWIGPLFDPDAAGCLHCLRRRLRHLRPAHRMAARFDPSRATAEPVGAIPGAEETASLMAAAEIAKWFAGAAPDLAGAIRTIDLRDWSSRVHRVIPHPACDICGKAVERRAGPPELRRRAVMFDADGGWRTVPPAETVRAYGHLMSPLTGIIGSLIPDTHAQRAGWSYVAEDIAATRAPGRLQHLFKTFRSSSIGKGMTGDQAQASALCEAIERYSAQLNGSEERRRGTYRELEPDGAIHPNAVMNFSDRQYRGREAWNAGHDSAFHFVPRRLDDDEPIDWSPVWSLTQGRRKLLPTDMLYYDQGRPRDRDRICLGDSNGCASGNVIEEAVLQAFLELAERDAVAVWWYNRLRRPAVDLNSFGDRWLSGVGDEHRKLGREVVALDLTNDLGIPVIAGLSHRPEGGEERIAIGYGCHLDARIAAQRALTEVCQMLNFDLAGDAAALDGFAGGWMRWATREAHPYLVPDESAPLRTRGDFGSVPCDDLLDAIEYCRGSVERRGMEMLVLDQTRDDAGMPVARVVVPGLRHFWPRFAPGRLYDVPVALGWLEAPRAESELNPLPFFF